MKTINFEVKNKTFKKGWYTCEVFGVAKIPTYWLVYENTAKNATKINNSGLMLEYFNSIPDTGTINAHKLTTTPNN